MNMDPGTWSQRVAAAVRAQMAAQHRSSRALAETLGVTEPTALKRLDGEIPFDVVELELVAAWLETTPSELMARAGEQAS